MNGFVLVTEAVPDVILEIRYHSTFNFVGQRVDGYEQPVAILTLEAAQALKQQISDLPTRVSWGEEGLIEAATMETADCVITAVVGMLGLKPTLAAIKAGKLESDSMPMEQTVYVMEFMDAIRKQWNMVYPQEK